MVNEMKRLPNSFLKVFKIFNYFYFYNFFYFENKILT